MNSTLKRGFRWTQTKGMQTIGEWLVDQGVAEDATKIQTGTADAVNADGEYLTFFSRNGLRGDGLAV